MTTSTLFRTSINVNYDIGEKEFFSNYLATPSHAESIIGLSRGFYDKNANTSHIMIGPYGSGKSLLATVLASFVSKKVSEETRNLLIEKFNDVHQDVFYSLKKLQDIDRTYIPVVLNGSYPDFGEAVIYAIEKTLEESDIYLNLPTERNNILLIVNGWEKDYPTTYKIFNELLEDKSIKFQTWIKKIEHGDKGEINWFKEIYPTLTSGAQFNGQTNADLVTNLEYIVERLKEENIGLFIIHDEFGRLLQNLEVDHVYQTMQDLQDIAELSNRSDQLFQLLLISHKGMSQYMLGLTETYQSEFQRIEKRYSSYFVESDTATFYRIVNKYLENYKLDQGINENIILDNTNKLRMFNLFQNLNQHEIENLVVKGCYPIHPVTLFLLPRISKVFGQNERTLFTYLESTHTYGFQNRLNHSKGNFIYSDTLFHYFFTEDLLHEINDENTKKFINTFQIINSNLDARKINAHRIVQFITMWEITNSNSIYKLDTNLIQFATDIDDTRLEELLEELKNLKFIRYNRIQDKWELSEGSSLVIEELVLSQKLKQNINPTMRLEEISNLLINKYYLAREYNDEKNITRFMKVQLLPEDVILSSTFSKKDLLLHKTDGVIYYVLLEDLQNINKVISNIKYINNPAIIFGILNLEAKDIYDIADDILAIKELLLNRKLLLENKNLKDELQLLLRDQEYEIEKTLQHFTNFDNNVSWFNKGVNISLNSHLDMENKISLIMNDLYSKTPIIMNDLVNRFNVIGIQKRSLYRVVDNILNNYLEENIGIEGQGPDYLIYATIIKNNGVSFHNLDQIDNEIYLSMRRKLLNHLAKNNEGSLLELYRILSGSPYGIRPPLIPLFFIMLLRDKWDQLMFYRNELFVPALEGEKIYEMFNEAEQFKYVFHDFEKSVVDFMNQVEHHIKSHISEHVQDETQLIRISSGLLNWLRSLPRQVQITEKHDEILLNLKKIIRRSEINPIQSLKDLIELFNNDFNIMKNQMNRLERSYNKFKKHLSQEILTLFNVKNYDGIKKFISSIDNNIIKRNRLLTVLIKNQEIEDIAFDYLGTKLEEWSDINYDLFIKQINDDFLSINSTQLNSDDNQIELFIDEDYKPIKIVDLSSRGELVFTNVNRIIQNAGRNLPREELEYVIYKLIKEHIE